MSSVGLPERFLQHFTNCLTKRETATIKNLYSSRSTLLVVDENNLTDDGTAKRGNFVGGEQIAERISETFNFSSLKVNTIDSTIDGDVVLITVTGEEVVDVYTIPFIRTFLLAKTNNNSYYIKNEILRYREKTRNTRKVVMTAGEAEQLGLVTKPTPKVSQQSTEKPKEVEATPVKAEPVVTHAVATEPVETAVSDNASVSPIPVTEPKTVQSEVPVIQATPVQSDSLDQENSKLISARSVKRIISANVVPKSNEASSETQTPVITPVASEIKGGEVKEPREKKPRRKSPRESKKTVEKTEKSATQSKAPVKPASWAHVVDPTLDPPVVQEEPKPTKPEKPKHEKHTKTEKAVAPAKTKEHPKKTNTTSSSSQNKYPEKTLYISNIPSSFDIDTVFSNLVAIGATDSTSFAQARDGTSFFFVTFETVEQAEDIARQGYVMIGKQKLKADLKRVPSTKESTIRRHTAQSGTGEGFVVIGKSKA